MPPDVNLKSLDAPDTTPGTPTTIRATINNREAVVPLFGPAACGGVVGSSQGHKTEVSIEVRDPGGAVVHDTTETVCAPGEQVGNDVDVLTEFTPEEAGEYTVRASTRVLSHDRDSDSAGPVALTVESEAGDLPDSTSPGGGLDFDPTDSDGDSPLDIGPDLPNTDVVLGVVVLALLAWALSSAEGILP